MTTSTAQTAHSHHYFVPQPSIYPFILPAGCSCWLWALSSDERLRAGPGMIAGAAVIIYVLFGWFGKVIAESQGGDYRPGRINPSATA